MNPTDITLYADVLQGMLDRILTKSAAENSGGLEAACLPDVADRASLEADRSLTLIMRERERMAAEDIRSALARMETGEYGVCEECGEDISPARLRVQPAATLCVHCKSLLEGGHLNIPGANHQYMSFDE
jgi:DnaK suppressor protein